MGKDLPRVAGGEFIVFSRASAKAEHWQIQGGVPGTRAPRGPNSFIFMQFSVKM